MSSEHPFSGLSWPFDNAVDEDQKLDRQAQINCATIRPEAGRSAFLPESLKLYITSVSRVLMLEIRHPLSRLRLRHVVAEIREMANECYWLVYIDPPPQKHRTHVQHPAFHCQSLSSLTCDFRASFFF